MEGVRVMRVCGEDNKRDIIQLNKVLRTSYGPWSDHTLLHSPNNSVITLTRSSSRILQHLATQNPLIKTLIAHLQSHAHAHKESTLYSGMLTCNLILQGLELQLPRHRVVMTIDHTLSVVLEWLRHPSCPITYQMNLDSVEQLVSLLHCYLATKISGWSHQDIKHLSTLILKGFLRALPREGVNNIRSISECLHIVPLPLVPANLSSLSDGLLLEEEVWSPITNWDHLPLRTGGRVLTAVFDISLAGDLPPGTDLRVTGLTSDGGALEEMMVEQLLNLGHVLVEKGVGLLACQKCVHPHLRDYLQREHVIVLQRLSSVMLGPVHQLSGGGALFSSTSCHALHTATFGVLSDVQPFQYHGHRFLQLRGECSLHSTLLLCSDWGRSLDELQPLCRDAMCVLGECVGDGHVIAGGGCGDTVIAHHIRTKVMEYSEVQRSDPVGEGCHGDVTRSVMMKIAGCFEGQALSLNHHGALVATDPLYHHCWFLPSRSHGDSDHHHDNQDHHHGDWRSITRCNCGAISLTDLPRDTVWKALSCSEQYQLNSFPFVKWRNGGHEKQRVFDLWTPRVAAIELAFELSRTLLSMAYAVSAIT